MAPHQLVVDAVGDVGDGEPTLLLGDRRVELDLVEQVAEFLDQVSIGIRGRIGRRRLGVVEGVDGVDDLVGLLKQVGDQRVVGLFDVPRTLLAQRARQRVETDVGGADRSREGRDPQRGEVVGVDAAIEVGPGHLDDLLVGGSERVQDRDRFVAGGFVDGELDVGQHPVGVGVRHEQRPSFAGGCGGELVAVDEADPGFDRVDAEPGPGDVEERQRGKQLEFDVVGFAQVPHRALEHEGRAGYRVEDLAVFAGGSNQRRCDVGVDGVEGVRSVVEMVECRRVGHEVGRRVDRRAQVAVLGMSDRLTGLDGDVIGAAGAESDDDDAWSLTRTHRQPNATTWPVAASNVP